jgi:hypothetical protein
MRRLAQLKVAKKAEEKAAKAADKGQRHDALGQRLAGMSAEEKEEFFKGAQVGAAPGAAPHLPHAACIVHCALCIMHVRWGALCWCSRALAAGSAPYSAPLHEESTDSHRSRRHASVAQE